MNEPDAYHRHISTHGGSKYVRKIFSVTLQGAWVEVDVYAVLEAFGVTCLARQHAVKKLLCAGLRGKGSQLDDLRGVLDAVWRAIELQEQREADEKPC